MSLVRRCDICGVEQPIIGIILPSSEVTVHNLSASLDGKNMSQKHICTTCLNKLGIDVPVKASSIEDKLIEILSALNVKFEE